MPLGISASTFRTRTSSARSGEVASRVRISRVTTAVTSSVYCSIFEKRSPPPTIFSTSIRPIFHRSAAVRLVIDRTVFASFSSSAFANYLSVVYCATKFQRNIVYRAHRFLRTSSADSTTHVAFFPRIAGQGRPVKVIVAH